MNIEATTDNSLETRLDAYKLGSNSYIILLTSILYVPLLLWVVAFVVFIGTIPLLVDENDTDLINWKFIHKCAKDLVWNNILVRGFYLYSLDLIICSLLGIAKIEKMFSSFNYFSNFVGCGSYILIFILCLILVPIHFVYKRRGFMKRKKEFLDEQKRIKIEHKIKLKEFES